jgi:hypothetical protein
MLPRSRVAVALACSVLGGCGPAKAPEPPLPAFVNVDIRGALIAPTKVGGSAWDGFGRLDGTAQLGLHQALRMVNPYAAAADFLANPTIAAIERPEPMGTVRATVNGTQVAALELPMAYSDTFTPLWSGARVSRLALTADTRVEVELIDKDLVKNDPMGAATITTSDVAAALRVGTVHHVNVAEQTNNQILFVDISAEPAR